MECDGIVQLEVRIIQRSVQSEEDNSYQIVICELL
jgi:hypothetical protein